MDDQAISVILHDSPEKLTFHNKPDDDLIVLPRETVYMIDRVVRQRTSRANLGTHDHFDDSQKASESKTPNKSRQSVKKGSKSVNYDDQEYGNSQDKTHNRDISLNQSDRKGLTYQEWYR